MARQESHGPRDVELRRSLSDGHLPGLKSTTFRRACTDRSFGPVRSPRFTPACNCVGFAAEARLLIWQRVRPYPGVASLQPFLSQPAPIRLPVVLRTTRPAVPGGAPATEDGASSVRARPVTTGRYSAEFPLFVTSRRRLYCR